MAAHDSQKEQPMTHRKTKVEYSMNSTAFGNADVVSPYRLLLLAHIRGVMHNSMLLYSNRYTEI